MRSRLIKALECNYEFTYNEREDNFEGFSEYFDYTPDDDPLWVRSDLAIVARSFSSFAAEILSS